MQFGALNVRIRFSWVLQRITMDDVLEELIERQLKVLSPLELPNEDMLVVAEEELLLPIPPDVRQFLLEASHIIYGTLEPITVADPHSHTYISEIAAVAWSLDVPRYVLPICETLGNYYCAEPEGEIVFWREGAFTDERWPCIWHWARDVWLES